MLASNLSTGSEQMELLCPAGNLPALKTAIDCGADAVYIGFKDDTNARHFAGLNFSGKKLDRAVEYVHDRNKKIHIALNTFAHPNGFQRWTCLLYTSPSPRD